MSQSLYVDYIYQGSLQNSSRLLHACLLSYLIQYITNNHEILLSNFVASADYQKRDET